MTAALPPPRMLASQAHAPCTCTCTCIYVIYIGLTHIYIYIWRRLFRQWEEDEGRLIVGSIKRIEIVNDEGALGVVYFPMPAWVQAVWTSAHVEEAKDEIVRTVKRDNPEVHTFAHIIPSHTNFATPQPVRVCTTGEAQGLQP